jgi:hypothetical protein
LAPPLRNEGQSAAVSSALTRPVAVSATAKANPHRRSNLPRFRSATLPKNGALPSGLNLSQTGWRAYAEGRDSRQKSRWPPNDRPRERDKRYSLSARRSSDQRPWPRLLFKNQR